MGEDGQNSGPMQEDLVQIAVNFLSIAMVTNTPVIHRRSFLEKSRRGALPRRR